MKCKLANVIKYEKSRVLLIFFHEKFEVIVTHIRIKYSIAEEEGKTKWKTFVCGFTEPDESRATPKVTTCERGWRPFLNRSKLILLCAV